MKISPKIGHSHLEEMELICDFICHFDVDRLLYAINGRHLDEDEILDLLSDVREYHAKLQRQRIYLQRFCRSFPQEFASDDNHAVDSSVKVSWRMRSGTGGARKVFKRFTKKSNKPLPPGVTERQAWEVSLISQPSYSIDLYGLSSYPQCVKDLFRAMFDFYQTMNGCLIEGLDCIKKVNAIKGDAKQCLDLLMDAVDKSQKHQKHLIEAMMVDPCLRQAVIANKDLSGDEANPVLKEYKRNTDGKEQFAQKFYKNCSPGDVSKITLYRAYAEAEQDPEVTSARLLFGEDDEHISRVNYAIEHFDELLPEKCKRSKIPAASLYYFYLWSQSTKGMSTFLSYFNRRYLKCGGKWETIGKSALTGAQKKYSPSGASGKEKRKMDYKIEKLLSARLPKIEKAS